MTPTPRKNATKSALPFNTTLAKREDIVAEFRTLIDNAACNEMTIKPFLEHYTNMIPTPWELNHGINFDFMFPQFPVSVSHKCDFFYMTKSTTTWWCVFVEIESPNARIFRENAKSVRRHSDFVQALDQIDEWKRYLRDHTKEFLERVCSVMTPFSGNPVQFRYVLIIGRRGEFERDHAKVRAYSELESGEGNSLRVMTYDALMSAALGGRWREYHLLSPNRHKFKFVKIIRAPSNVWQVFGPDTLTISSQQRQELKGAGIAIDAWSAGAKLGNFGVATEADLDEKMYSQIALSLISKKRRSTTEA